MQDYHIDVFFTDEDECYVADISDLQYWSAVGDTAEEAVHEVVKAKRAWLRAAKKEKKPIPRPRYRPAIYQINGKHE